jgi:hypothetical protein
MQRLILSGEYVERADVESARDHIAACEAHMGFELTEGQRRDLVCDQFPDWSWTYVAAVVAAIKAHWFTESF